MQSKNVLIAVLNWGIGHATRSIPIITELVVNGYTPVIASDGNALLLLRKEFPSLKYIELPTYGISYPINAKWLKWKLILNLPRVIRAIQLENKLVRNLVESESLIGIISDNRIGVRSSEIPSIYITHQLKVYSGLTTFLTSKIHQYFIQKFDECWIPDSLGELKLSGQLSKVESGKNQKFIGVVSRFRRNFKPKKYDLMILLSGVEPLRSQLEAKLISELERYTGKVLFIKGIINRDQEVVIRRNVTYYNFMFSDELEKAINESEMVLSRSGYSTILDLAALGKKVFFIPTTGQYEQEYLAKHLEKSGIAPFSNEKDFNIEMLKRVENYTGFSDKFSSSLHLDLENFFERK